MPRGVQDTRRSGKVPDMDIPRGVDLMIALLDQCDDGTGRLHIVYVFCLHMFYCFLLCFSYLIPVAHRSFACANLRPSEVQAEDP